MSGTVPLLQRANFVRRRQHTGEYFLKSELSNAIQFFITSGTCQDSRASKRMCFENVHHQNCYEPFENGNKSFLKHTKKEAQMQLQKIEGKFKHIDIDEKKTVNITIT